MYKLRTNHVQFTYKSCTNYVQITYKSCTNYVHMFKLNNGNYFSTMKLPFETEKLEKTNWILSTGLFYAYKKNEEVQKQISFSFLCILHFSITIILALIWSLSDLKFSFRIDFACIQNSRGTVLLLSSRPPCIYVTFVKMRQRGRGSRRG